MAHSDTGKLRILPFIRATGAFQLAVTEAVIDAVGQRKAPATLRMYSWSRDAVILGIGQSASQLDFEACREAGCDILRRISGGTAVYHDRNTVSFQLVLPDGHPNLTYDIHRNYRLIAEIAVSMLASFGVQTRLASISEAGGDAPPSGLEAICFSSLSPYEILAGNRKLVGLAQVRRRTVSALQGMVYLRNDPAKSVRLVSRDAELRDRLSDVLGQRSTDLATETGRTIDAEEVAFQFRHAAVAALDADEVEAGLTTWEIERARELESARYGNDDWTFRR